MKKQKINTCSTNSNFKGFRKNSKTKSSLSYNNCQAVSQTGVDPETLHLGDNYVEKKILGRATYKKHIKFSKYNGTFLKTLGRPNVKKIIKTS